MASPEFRVRIELKGDEVQSEFLVGRASLVMGRRSRHDAPEGSGARFSLFQLEDREPYRVSRRHCAIEVRQGGLWLIDVTSRLGTLVNGQPIGGESGRTAARLMNGENEIVLGGGHSPHRLRIEVELAA